MPPKKRALAESSSTNNAAPPAKKRGPRPNGLPDNFEAILKDVVAEAIDEKFPAVPDFGDDELDDLPVARLPLPRKPKKGEHPADRIKLESEEYPNALTEWICIGHSDPKEAPKKMTKKVSMKPAAEFPEWKWVISRAALALKNTWLLGEQKRDQDLVGCYFYNDFSGYGQHENLENMVQAAYTEFTNVPFDVARYWTHVQAIGFFLHEADLVPWNMIDDSDRIDDFIPLIGAVILAGLNKLDRSDLLEPNSSIRNIALVCSLYLEFAKAESGMFSEGLEGWPARIIAYCKHFDIELSKKTALNEIDALVKHFEDKKVKYEKFKKAAEDRWGFGTAYNRYWRDYHNGNGSGKNRRIGGIRYDITKMSKVERVRASFTKVDPLEEMGTPPSDG